MRSHERDEDVPEAPPIVLMADTNAMGRGDDLRVQPMMIDGLI